MADISAELMKKIRRLQFYTSHLADDILAGAYRSAFKGRGMEFEEVREYSEGDDVRTIDWHVTAKMNRPYVKTFREERELTVMLIVDISSSTNFGSGQQSKREYIAEIAALLAFSAIKNNDKIGLILFSDKVEKYFPPNKGTRHVLRLIRELLTTSPKSHGTRLDIALAFFGKIQVRSSICFVISDFICENFSKEAALIARHHELISIAVIDPSEKILPHVGLITLTDFENGQTLVTDALSKNTQTMLAEATARRLDSEKKGMQKIGGDFVLISTDVPYLTQLHKFFLMRQKRLHS